VTAIGVTHYYLKVYRVHYCNKSKNSCPPKKNLYSTTI